MGFAHDNQEKKSLEEIAGDFLREAAVLVFIFMFLEPAVRGTSPTGLEIMYSAIVSVLFLISGTVLERLR